MSTSVTNSEDSSSIVSEVSRFVVKVLRHTPEEFGITLNSRGWASVKDLRTVISREFSHADQSAGELLKSVLDADTQNRFQFVESDDGQFGFVRATRKHTADAVDLLAVTPDEEDLSWYLVRYDERNADYVEAVSASAALRVVETRLTARDSEEVAGASVEPADTEPYINKVAPDRGDTLSGNEPPHRVVHQDGRKPLEVFKRINQMGTDIGRYGRSQPERVRNRLPPEK